MRNEKALGTIYAVASYMLWGVLPLYWKLIQGVFSIEILAHRILWAFVFVALIIICTRQLGQVKSIVSDRKQFFFICIAAVLITINWGLYIWAVNSNRILDASLGYYINPLFAVVLGVVFFKEKLDYSQGVAIVAASIGVIILTVQYGKFPWVSLGLAVSFGLYGAMKKLVKVNSIIGLTMETAVITPIAIAYIIIRETSGQGAVGNQSFGVIALLLAAGVVTAVPLLLFSEGAKRIPLSTLGFTQYISPTISLFIGVFVYHEKFTLVNIISFCFIWFGLAIYSMSQLGIFKNKKNLVDNNSETNKIKDAV